MFSILACTQRLSLRVDEIASLHYGLSFQYTGGIAGVRYWSRAISINGTRHCCTKLYTLDCTVSPDAERRYDPLDFSQWRYPRRRMFHLKYMYKTSSEFLRALFAQTYLLRNDDILIEVYARYTVTSTSRSSFNSKSAKLSLQIDSDFRKMSCRTVHKIRIYLFNIAEKMFSRISKVFPSIFTAW